MADTRVFMLGRFDIWCDEQRVTPAASQKACELVAYLLIFRKVPHHRDRLAALLWAEASPTQARTYLRKTLWQIQSTMPEESAVLCVDPEWIDATEARNYWLDLAEFEAIYRATKGIAGHELTEAALPELQRAVTLYRGDLLEGWYQDWCVIERGRLTRMNMIILDKLVEHALHHGDFENGIDYANQLLRWDRARERTHYDLMCLYAMAGERTAVLNQYDLCRAILWEELGVEPAAQTVALYNTVRNQQIPPSDVTHQELHYAQHLTNLLRTLDQANQSMVQLRHNIRQELSRLRPHEQH